MYIACSGLSALASFNSLLLDTVISTVPGGH